MYLSFWLFWKYVSQAPPGWLWGTTKEAMHLILGLLLTATSQAPPKGL